MLKHRPIVLLMCLLTLTLLPSCSLLGQSPLQVLGRTDSLALHVTFSPDGQLVAMGSLREGAKVWRLDDTSLLYTLGDNRVNAIAFSPDNQLIVAGSGAGETSTVTIWNRSNGSLVRILDPTLTPWVQSLAIAPDGQSIAVGTSNKVHLFNLSDGTLIQTFDTSGVSVAYSPDGQLLAIAENLPIVRIWHIKTQQVVHTLPGHGSSIMYSSDGRLLASPGWNNQGMVTFQGADALPTTAAGNDDIIQLWNTQNGSAERAFTGHTGQIHGIAFSPDDQFMVSGAIDNTIRLWRVSDGAEISRVNVQQNPASVAFAPSGNSIVIAVGDTVYLWPVGDLIRPQ